MRQYHSDNKNYNAILDAMAQIRQNQLNESYGYYAEEDEEEHMQEAMHGDEEEMEEEQMSDDEAEMVAEMLDEALAEIYEEDDEDNHQIDEADGGERRKRRRNNLLKAAAIGAGLVALGGAGAAGMGLLPGAMGQQAVQGALSRAGQFAKNIPANASNLAFRYKTRNAPSTRRPMGGKGPQAQSNAMPDTFDMAAYNNRQNTGYGNEFGPGFSVRTPENLRRMRANRANALADRLVK